MLPPTHQVSSEHALAAPARSEKEVGDKITSLRQQASRERWAISGPPLCLGLLFLISGFILFIPAQMGSVSGWPTWGLYAGPMILFPGFVLLGLAILPRDRPVIMGCTLLISIAFSLVALLDASVLLAVIVKRKECTDSNCSTGYLLGVTTLSPSLRHHCTITVLIIQRRLPPLSTTNT